MIRMFLTHIENERRYSLLTVRNYRRDIELFDAWRREQVAKRIAEAEAEGEECSDKPEIQYTKPDDIREWIVARGKSGKLSPATINRELSSLRSFFGFLRERGVIKKDLFTHISTLKKPKRLPVSVAESHIPKVL